MKASEHRNPNTEDRAMARELAGKTITITTTKDTTPDEISELIKLAFQATTHPLCYSGAHLLLRQADVVKNDDSSSISIG
jgi:hypothetical protein